MRLSSVIVGLLVALGAASCGNAADRAAAAAPQAPHPALAKVSRAQAGQSAPSFAFERRDRKPATLAAFRGRPVLVNLWATWCAPCIAEMPALDRLMGRAQGRLTVLAISQDLGGWRAVDGFARPGRFKNLVIATDKENAWALGLKSRGLPMTILYDAQGREVWRLAGPAEWDQVPAGVFLR